MGCWGVSSDRSRGVSMGYRRRHSGHEGWEVLGEEGDGRGDSAMIPMSAAVF